MITPVRTSKRAESGQRRHRGRLATAVVRRRRHGDRAPRDRLRPRRRNPGRRRLVVVLPRWRHQRDLGRRRLGSRVHLRLPERRLRQQGTGSSPRRPPTPPRRGDPIKVPYTWQGLHAWFGVTAQLQAIVNGNPVATPETQVSPADGLPYLVNAGPSELLHHALQRLPVRQRRHVHQPRGWGHTTASASSARNGDFNNFLQGTFTLSTPVPTSTRPSVPDNRQWIGADGS